MNVQVFKKIITEEIKNNKNAKIIILYDSNENNCVSINNTKKEIKYSIENGIFFYHSHVTGNKYYIDIKTIKCIKIKPTI